VHTGRIDVRQDGPILWVRLDRPEAMNAYTAEMGADLVDALTLANGEDSIRAVILTGRGRVFCAGADVSAGAGSFDTESGDGATNFGTRGNPRDSNFIGAMMGCHKPLIVAFNGAAAGVGLTLTFPCDIRIAADTAKFAFVFTRRGLVPEAGSTWFLPQLVGLPRALRWCMAGATVTAEDALRAGLVSELCPADQLEERARTLALEIAAQTAPIAVSLTRRMLWRYAGDPDPSGALSVDAALNMQLGSSPDVYEGVSAFLQKRAPDFPGRVSADMDAMEQIFSRD
jgi:enoyl-CoA hydratase/carnithine racemase